MRYVFTLAVMFLLVGLPGQAQDPAPQQVLTSTSLAPASAEKPEEDTPEEVPTALVERIQVVGGTITRISLFDNRVVVVTMRDHQKQFFFRKWTLSTAEYSVYFNALLKCATRAGLVHHENLDEDQSVSTIYLRLPGRKPRRFRISPLQVQDIATSSLSSILDDIQQRVSSLAPSAEALQHWQPKEGDRVELYDGSFATVDEVREEGVIILQHEETSILEVVPFEARAKVIFRIIQ